jgi:nucleoside-diphosphate-sugar epimerase
VEGSEVRSVAARTVRSLVGSHRRFAITGASGWLGRSALALLADALPRHDFVGAVTAYASAAKMIAMPGHPPVGARPLADLARGVDRNTVLLHFAYLTRERSFDHLSDYVAANVAITGQVIAALDQGVAGVFLASSGAVYEPGGGLAVDLLRNPYGTLKHIDELAIRQAAESTGAACTVARIFSLGGRAMSKPRHYALGDFVLQTLAGRPIDVRAAHRVIRSYSLADDVVTLGLATILRPASTSGVTFDTGGDEIEIGDLAVRVQRLLGRTDLGIIRPQLDDRAPPDRYVGNGESMTALSRHYGLPLTGIDGVIRDTAFGLQDPPRA